jgi:hypothetical protein
MSEDLQCPIDHVKVNENKVRVVALLVLLLGAGFLLTGYNFIILLLLVDFLHAHLICKNIACWAGLPMYLLNNLTCLISLPTAAQSVLQRVWVSYSSRLF